MPIGVYDSGIGGLTVYRALAAKFPELDMMYLGDSARVPYGNKSPETIIKNSLECASYLASRHKLSAFVVACNTISSHALGALHEELKIPILGVIKPGATHAVNVTKNNKIGVLATHATVDSGSYLQEIKAQSCGENIQVFQQACPLFVPLVEEALVDGDMVETVVRESLKDISKKGVDTIILGCTHYPVLSPVIKKFFSAVNIVDSTDYIIKDLHALGIRTLERGKRKIYITDESHAFHSLKKMLVGEVEVEVINIFK